METNADVNKWRESFYIICARDSVRNLKKALSSEDYRCSPEVIELFNEIKEKFDSSDERFFRPLKCGTKVYRARTVENIGHSEVKAQGIEIDDFITQGYDETNSKEAPIGKTPAGRNNISGVSYFYCTEDPATACAELKEPVRTVISVAEFELLRDITVFDFGFDRQKHFRQSELDQTRMSLGTYWGGIMSFFQDPVSNENDYRITQIIAEEIRKQGCDGLCYSSFFGDGVNYTFFHCGSRFLSFKSSRLVTLMYSNQILWDYNNKSILESYPNHESYAYNEKDAHKHLERIKNSWINNS